MNAGDQGDIRFAGRSASDYGRFGQRSTSCFPGASRRASPFVVYFCRVYLPAGK
jgi:hypothetical protein